MSYDDGPDSRCGPRGGYKPRGVPSATLLAWCVIALLVFAIGVTVIQ
jgi:hypothetical protein